MNKMLFMLECTCMYVYNEEKTDPKLTSLHKQLENGTGKQNHAL